MRKWQFGCFVPWAVGLAALIGCADNPANLRYLGNAGLNYYKEAATDIEYPAVESQTTGEVMATEKPRAVNDPREDQIRDLTLEEAIRIALENSTVIRTTNAPLATGNLPTIYDPAIQESGVLFGGRGVESALSVFDPRWNTSMFWGRDESVQNNRFLSGGAEASTVTSETAFFDTQLQKLFANGGSFAVTHNWNYQWLDVDQPFPSTYTGSVGAEYRLPLLAGSGTEYTRIAGPIATSFGGITGVNQGVVIARINNDITLADFELSVRNLVKDVEDAYWDLYLQYRLYDTAVQTRNSTLEIWRKLKITLELGGNDPDDITAEPQAREQYYETRAATATALGNLYSREVVLRRLMGLPSNDGQILRPIDEPPMAEFVPDWELSLAESLTNRTELRRQKFNIKSLELQLRAAQSLVRPRLDFVSGYRVNGFGDRLLAYNDDDRLGTAQGLNSAYETITQGDQTGWNLGFSMTMDLGFRSAHAQVRNIELRLAKARDLLASQELDISHELSIAYQTLATNYAAAQANFNRLRASQRRIQLFKARVEITDPDLELRAQLSRAQAEAAYYTNQAEYAKSIAQFHFAKGDLLEFNSVHLAESLWTPAAYDQALRKAMARSHAIENPFLVTEPEEFVYPGGDHVITVDPVELGMPIDPALEPMPEGMSDEDMLKLIPPPAEEKPKTEPQKEDAAETRRPYEPEFAEPYEEAAAINVTTPAVVEGATVGQMKPSTGPSRINRHKVDRAGFFEAFAPSEFENTESIELDAKRDLLQ